MLEVSRDPPSVVVKVHTHSGLRPASHPEERRKDRVQPGITHRDIRFAYLLENLPVVQENPTASDIPAEAQPRTVVSLEERRHV